MSNMFETDNTVQSNSVFNKVLYGNSIQDYLIGGLIIVGGIMVIKIIRKFLRSRLVRVNTPVTNYLLQIENFLYPIAYVLIIFGAIHWLNMPPKTETFIKNVFHVAFTFLAIRLIAFSIRNAIFSYVTQKDETGEKIKQVNGIVLILSGIVWIIGIIFLFDNLGFNVTAVLTGLGVGGIAIALAAQTILGDIFNYFVIFFDRPFELGDFIIVDDKMGTVEYIGLKTTRLKSLGGEQIIFSNSYLTNSRIHNYKRMTERRIVFRLNFVYETSKDKLAIIPSIIRTIIESQPDTRFDRAHFASFGEYSLGFEVVYYMLSPDYNRYMDIQEQINLSLYEAFESQGISFAFPTYSVNMQGRLKNEENGNDYAFDEKH
jgi:small-conductance mechanosensitive channel